MGYEKLCIFCKHFQWDSERCYGHGSEYTGPMFEGGDAICCKGHHKDSPEWGYPADEQDMRKIILRAEHCADYAPPKGK